MISVQTKGINESANFPPRLSVICCYLPRLPSTKMVSCRECPCDSASCRDSRQEAQSHGQSLQEAIYQAQQSRQEAWDHGQSQRKPNMTDSLCRKRKLADSFISCEHCRSQIALHEYYQFKRTGNTISLQP